MTNCQEKRNWLEFSTREKSLLNPLNQINDPGVFQIIYGIIFFPVCSDAIYPAYRRFFLAASPLVSSAFGRTCVGLRPTKRSSPTYASKNLWYPGQMPLSSSESVPSYFWRHLLILQINIQIELTNQSFTIIYAKHDYFLSRIYCIQK